jgi:hypothetical protein
MEMSLDPIASKWQRTPGVSVETVDKVIPQ